MIDAAREVPHSRLHGLGQHDVGKPGPRHFLQQHARKDRIRISVDIRITGLVQTVERLLIESGRHQHEHAFRCFGTRKPARRADRTGIARLRVRVIAAGIEHEEGRTRSARGNVLDQRCGV